MYDDLKVAIKGLFLVSVILILILIGLILCGSVMHGLSRGSFQWMVWGGLFALGIICEIIAVCTITFMCYRVIDEIHWIEVMKRRKAQRNQH